MISILIPTLGERKDELIRLLESLKIQSYKEFEVIIISQDNHDVIKEIKEKYTYKIKHIINCEKGLSKSRNLGINQCDGDLLLLSDDDAWYPKNALKTIISEFQNEDSDIICFKIYDPILGKEYKRYKKHRRQVRSIQILKKSSIEICFNIKKIKKEELRFNEDFGLGSKYISGEENIILKKLIDLKYKVVFVDKIIVYHRKKENISFSTKYIESKAMLIKEIYGKNIGFFILNILLLKNIKRIKQNKIKEIFQANKYIIK